MSTSKRTLQERVEEKDLQIEKKLQELKQLQEQKRQLDSRRKADEARARAHRLIQVGGAVESVLGCPIEEEDIPRLIKYLTDQEQRGRYFSRAMNKDDKPEADDQVPMWANESETDDTF